MGSNLFNILGVLAALAITVPFGVPDELRQVDIWFMAAATLLLIPVLISGYRIGRGEGAFFLEVDPFSDPRMRELRDLLRGQL